MSEPLILCIETALASCSVAVCKGSLVLSEQISHERNRAAELLHPQMEEAMLRAGVDWQQLQAVAVSGGPGSYTGLRIGVSAAKGICYATGIPLIHVETMQAMQAAVRYRMDQQAVRYVAIMDARRNDAFVSVMDKDGNYIEHPSAVTLEPGMFASHSQQGKCILMGDGVKKYVNHGASDFMEMEITSIHAGDMAGIAFKKYVESDFEDVAYYVPKYYKEAFLTKKM